MSDGLDALLSGLPRHAPLGVEEERALVVRAQAGDTSAGKELATRNIRLVIMLAGDYSRPCVALDDLVQEGVLGLMRAVETFDATRGVRFGTYAKWWIRAYARRFANGESDAAAELGPDDADIRRPDSEASDPEAEFGDIQEQRLARRAVNDAMGSLTAQERRVLRERIIGGKQARHVAAKMGLSARKVFYLERLVTKKVVAAARNNQRRRRPNSA